MRRIKVIAVILILLCLVFCAACQSPAGSGNEGQEQAGGESDSSFAVTDMTGNTVEFDRPVEKIVVLTAADCEIIYALGAGDMVVGRGSYCDYPAETADVTELQSGSETNIEQIVSLQPDVVFMSTMDQSVDQVEALRQAGMKVVVSEAQNIDGVYQAIRMVGQVLQKDAEAEDLIKNMQDTFAQVSQQVSEEEEHTVYFEVSPLEYGLWTAGSNTFMDEIASMLGLKNIFADVEGWGEVSEEQVIERNPDYIISITMYMEGETPPEEEIMSRPGWQQVAAVQNQQVWTMDSNMISRPGPRLAEAAQALYANVYGDQ
ncbi:MAG: ABC transporter substrate-binding protein [Firmicutes bacterium]|nr:ABC transporter substrate-binding protein [Bacillota bacterium]